MPQSKSKQLEFMNDDHTCVFILKIHFIIVSAAVYTHVLLVFYLQRGVFLIMF